MRCVFVNGVWDGGLWLQVDGAAPAPGTGTILFNNSKRETHHPNNGFKKLGRRLKGTYKLAT